jgi:hypothetical protein
VPDLFKKPLDRNLSKGLIAAGVGVVIILIVWGITSLGGKIGHDLDSAEFMQWLNAPISQIKTWQFFVVLYWIALMTRSDSK